MSEEFENDFEDFSQEPQTENSETPQAKVRIPLPKGKEVIGIIEQRFGGNKMNVLCTDGKTRNCRVPGRLKRRLWLRPEDVVIIEPWELDDSKGDILLKYTPHQAKLLRQKGYLETESLEF